MRFDVRDNFSEVKRALAQQQKQIAFATAVALTKTAQDVRAAERREMERVFDKPTRYTLNSLYIKPATKQSLTAVVWLKDDTSKGTPAGKYLLPQIEGGTRVPKRFEEWLQRAGHLASGWFAVPGQGARLNAHGNMSAGQITQILSALQAHPDVYARSTKNSKKRNPRQAEYFASKGGHLPYGVWQRTRTGVKPVLIFVKQVSYKKRLDFFGVARKVIDARFEHHWRAAIDMAWRAAR